MEWWVITSAERIIIMANDYYGSIFIENFKLIRLNKWRINKMLKKQTGYILAAMILLIAPLAHASPYDPGFGFDRPSEWTHTMNWTRGDAGTIYAEWDNWRDAVIPGTRTANPEIGLSGASSALHEWSIGTFVTGTDNLYSFTVPSYHTINITDGYNVISAPPIDGYVAVVMQHAIMGIRMGYDGKTGDPWPNAVLLNNMAPTSNTETFAGRKFIPAMGFYVDVAHSLLTWELTAPAAIYTFDLKGGPHMSLTNLAIDIAPVPLPAAVWLFGLALLGLVAVRRKKITSS